MLIKNDTINDAMLYGLFKTIKEELKEVLMQKAEEEIEPIINQICERLKVNLINDPIPFTWNRHLKLECIIKKEK